jgi:hypothetical protein
MVSPNFPPLSREMGTGGESEKNINHEKNLILPHSRSSPDDLP